MKHITVFFISALMVVCASAFEAGFREFESHFEAGKCQLSPNEAAAVTAWTQRYRDRDGIISLSIDVGAYANDPASNALAWCRAKTLSKLLRPIVNVDEIVPINISVWIREPDALRVGPGNVAIVVPQPTCTRTRQCGPIPIEEGSGSQ